MDDLTKARRALTKLPGADATPYEVGYKKPPEHSRFKPGRSGNPLGPGRVHEQARALQVTGAAEAGRENEMAFEQRVRGAKFPQHFLFRHGSGNRRGNARLQLPWNRRLRE